MKNVYITAGVRTPIGAMGGAFASLTAVDLSIPVMKELVSRSGVNASDIDDVFCQVNVAHEVSKDC